MFAAHDHINLQISSEREKPPAIVNLFLDCFVCVCVCVCLHVCIWERYRDRASANLGTSLRSFPRNEISASYWQLSIMGNFFFPL